MTAETVDPAGPIAAPAPAAAAPAATGGERSVTIRGRRYPVLLPRVRDPRMHVAAVIITVQVLGQTVLGFDVSIAQILIAIGTAGVIELGLVAWSRQVIAWPASALLTGNGVALILRTPGTEHGDWWSTNGWPMFVAAAGVGLLSKYAIVVRGRHLFNPSNLGLVLVFLIFGARYADPQDLWWGLWRPALAVTLAVIFVGGITLSIRLRLFTVALTFWATFAVGIAVLAANGHAITARWHVGPVADWTYWWVFVFSPEIVIFVFFMITDPRTAPLGRVARPVYAAAVGVLAAVMAGFQHTEFATKVSLLLALTVVCAFRPLLESRLPDRRFAGGTSRWIRPARSGGPALRPTLAGIGGIAVLAVLSGAAVRAAGSTTAGRAEIGVAATSETAAGAPATKRPTVDLAAGAVPRAQVDPAIDDVAGGLPEGEAQRVVRDLVEDLAIEGDAIQQGDAALAATATVGDRRADTEGLIQDQADAEQVSTPTYRVDRARVVLLQDPVNPQALPQLGVLAEGEMTVVVRAGFREDLVLDQRTEPFEAIYLMAPVGHHYLIAAQLPAGSDMRVRPD